MKAYLDQRNRILAPSEGGARHPRKEFRVVRSALMMISRRALELEGATRRSRGAKETGADGRTVGNKELNELADILREIVLLSGSMDDSRETAFESGPVWNTFVFRSLSESPEVDRIISESERIASGMLPEKIVELRDSREVPEAWSGDLRALLPKIGTILSYLRLISQMLETDEPLKKCILLFSRVDELMREVMEFINNRLQRFPDDTDALFGSLDGAAYTASIELRKVHSNELKGLVEIRPTPIVFARIETAYSLLNDSLQMTLVNFAQLLDRDLEPTDIFPELLTKEQQSIQLRENMWHLLQIVQKIEQDPDSSPPEELKRELIGFRDKNLYFLFYKDMETVERFIEEVIVTGDKKDLVPLLHRFGAYLETLLGQVNMRVVLANHPFEPLQQAPHDFGGLM
ncbi:MAG: hypothetical protein DWQ47_15290 [Acidobacteria bacterium]|nr:MAG: hypothetical protein DWQ32_02690 [Acidobacteriota bacterium]REK02574.1 MAG: hypothetical protein DWQ38_09445 [Acidobacteriota bacterium]REK13623.1 MAG: hypothetical protein DWQ43_08380 [Acidobacteriota bacterium]REK41617.1 MAG: hypothetical protein DWQ47_15290 [Acidobacteriota bacterium]